MVNVLTLLVLRNLKDGGDVITSAWGVAGQLALGQGSGVLLLPSSAVTEGMSADTAAPAVLSLVRL